MTRSPFRRTGLSFAKTRARLSRSPSSAATVGVGSPARRQGLVFRATYREAVKVDRYGEATLPPFEFMTRSAILPAILDVQGVLYLDTRNDLLALDKIELPGHLGRGDVFL